ncbi:MAG: glycosyltransferase family 2 protein [Bacteroidetes bacterium]|nr:glycosyltransferase family 2 protein [Bacteroidota bacterium]MBS1649688.1 glycosyltransferase family 2 protein [Bacteroidota bacterium]
MILSIICPTYNEENYIATTLESFLHQQHHSFELEILICDGMSTDATRTIVKQIAEKNSNVKLVDNINRKTPFAFNVGLREAKGEYIAILGAHTKYDNNYLQACFDDLIKHNVTGVSGRVITQAATNNFEAKIGEWVMLSNFGVSGNSFRMMKEGFTHSVNFPVFKKQALIDLGGYNETMERNQDNDMNQRLIDAGHELYCTWKTTCYYRPPASLNKLMRYAFKGGFWNAKSLYLHHRSMRLHHFVPFFFVLALIALPILGIAEYLLFATTYCFKGFAAIVVLHLIAGCLATIQSLIQENNFKKIILPFIFFGFHFSYGWGTLNGLLKQNK